MQNITKINSVDRLYSFVRYTVRKNQELKVLTEVALKWLLGKAGGEAGGWEEVWRGMGTTPAAHGGPEGQRAESRRQNRVSRSVKTRVLELRRRNELETEGNSHTQGASSGSRLQSTVSWSHGPSSRVRGLESVPCRCRGKSCPGSRQSRGRQKTPCLGKPFL